MPETPENEKPGPAHPQNEVTLTELWLIVQARKVAVALIAAAVLAAGLVYIVIAPPQYRFTTVIEIGNQPLHEEIVPIEDLNTAIAKLKDGYIPTTTISFVAEHAQGPRNYAFEVSGSEESQIVTIASRAPRDAASLHRDLHGRVAAKLIEDHNRTADSLRDRAAILVAEARERLVRLEAEEAAAREQADMFGRAISENEKLAAETAQRLVLLDKQLSALGGRSDQTGATQAMLISQQMSNLMSLQSELQTVAAMELHAKRSALEARLASLVQEQETAKALITSRQTDLRTIQATRILGDGTIMSIDPVAPDRVIVMLVALILGVAGGVAVALVMDFFAKARRQAAAF